MSIDPLKGRKSNGAGKTGGPATTVSHFFGEIVWLLTQSRLHRALRIGDLEWLAMPALLHEQFYLFRDGERPIGLAMWAKCDAAAAAKLERGMIEPENRLTLEEWTSGDQIWLVDLIAPFANDENRHREWMMADLVTGPLAGKAFRFHQVDDSGTRIVQTVDAEAAERLKDFVASRFRPSWARACSSRLVLVRRETSPL